MIRNKTIKFNLDNQGDRELWEWLSSLPHGEFSMDTKRYWETRMNNRRTSWGPGNWGPHPTIAQQIKDQEEQK